MPLLKDKIFVHMSGDVYFDQQQNGWEAWLKDDAVKEVVKITDAEETPIKPQYAQHINTSQCLTKPLEKIASASKLTWQLPSSFDAFLIVV